LLLMLKRIKIKGYKSIKEQLIDLKRINLLIGANGAGKSNFVSFFKMLNYMNSNRLQLYIGQSGGADTLLFYGSKVTQAIESRFFFETDDGTNFCYIMNLNHASQDTLIFAKEEILKKTETAENLILSGSGHKESLITADDNEHYKIIQNIIKQWQYFQFHDTSETAKFRGYGYINDNQYLRSGGENLGAFLYMLKKTRRAYYQRIISVIRRLVPLFDDFILEKSKLNENQIILNWKEKDSDIVFGPHQLSDGSLRMTALVTLLFQAENELPSVILIDEPELGLHPYAIEVLVSLIRHASAYCQIIVATQSADLMDHFEPDEIIITERHEKETFFKRLDSENLKEWRAEYSMSELWKKNVLGGTP